MNIIAGIIIYEPDFSLLKRTIESVSKQCDKIVLFQNSRIQDEISIELKEKYNLTIIGNGENKGMGYAQNCIIVHSKNDGCKYLILSDQDTIYPDNYVKVMLGLNSWNFTIASPAWENTHQNKGVIAKQYVLNGSKIVLKKPDNECLISHCISSGMFIALDNLKLHELADENLHIDWVDNDWCWQLVSNGHKIIYTPNTVLSHDLGDKEVAVLGKRYTVRNKIRDYYIIRNAIYILKFRRYKIFVKNYLRIKIVHHIIFSLVTNPKQFTNRIPIILKAVFDGKNGKLGAYNPITN